MERELDRCKTVVSGLDEDLEKILRELEKRFGGVFDEAGEGPEGDVVMKSCGDERLG